MFLINFIIAFTIIVLFLVFAAQELRDRDINSYNKYKVLENENGWYVVKYVKYYLYGFIPMWRWLKKKCPISLDEEAVEFQHKELAHNIMLDYYELARHDYNITKIKNKTL